MKNKLNVGVIGLGRLGRVYASDLAHLVPDSNLIAVADEQGQLAESFANCNAVIERANDKLYIYTKEECTHLEKMLADTRSWLRRPANLEDLFIQLTGRSLRES